LHLIIFATRFEKKGNKFFKMRQDKQKKFDKKINKILFQKYLTIPLQSV